MQVTAEEAKGKLCPMMQRNCVGEGCMMWEDAGSEFRGGEDDAAVFVDTFRCGLSK